VLLAAARMPLHRRGFGRPEALAQLSEGSSPSTGRPRTPRWSRPAPLRSADPLEDATLLCNAAGWTYRHLRSGHHWTPGRASARVVELLLDGLTRAPAAPAAT
jgi:hypothetical protein